VNDRELNADGPSPLESLVRPEERAASDVPQDISPEAILSLVVQNRIAWRKRDRLDERVNAFYVGGHVALLELEVKLRERMDANSMPPG
jgi:hypothetical protein